MNLLRKLKPVFFLFLFVSTILLFGGFYYLYTKLDNDIQDVSQSVSSEGLSQLVTDQEVEEVPEVVDVCGEACKEEIARVVSEAVATLSGTTKTIVQTTAPSTSAQTSYIPLGATTTTTSTSWVDVEDSSVYIDVISEYGENANVSWEATLKVAHGNGQAFARLYDDTNKIAVDFSELSTVNNASYARVSSGSLPFWRGRNLYKVQIKSLNSFVVTYSGGRIKISY